MQRYIEGFLAAISPNAHAQLHEMGTVIVLYTFDEDISVSSSSFSINPRPSRSPCMPIQAFAFHIEPKTQTERMSKFSYQAGSITFCYREGSTDKAYQAGIVPKGGDRFLVNFTTADLGGSLARSRRND